MYVRWRTDDDGGAAYIRRQYTPLFNPKELTINTSRPLIAALIAALPLLSMSAASAQPPQQSRSSGAYAPVIRGFNVDEVRRLEPGVELNFDLYGTPGGWAVIHIGGANRNLTLTETDPGQYEGVYTIGSRDHIDARSAVTANLRVGNQVTSGVLSESLLRGVGFHPGGHANAGPAAVPRIERFDVQGVDDLRAGDDLQFSLTGTPGAKVDMAIAGARGVFFLVETRPGEYIGNYTIRRGDRVAPNSVVTANLRIGDRVTTATLGQPLLALQPTPAPARPERYCGNCATIDAVNVVEVSGEGNYLGAVGGGVVGALLGSQVGGGNGRTAAELAGALGGAYAGRNIERNANKTRHFEVVVRYIHGGTQTITFENDPGVHIGDRVKVNNGVITRD